MNTPADRDYIDAKAEAIAASLSVNAMEYQTSTNSSLDGMSARLDEMNAQLHVTNNRLDVTNSRLDETNNRLEETNNRLKETNSRLDATNKRLDEMDGRIKDTNSRLDATNARLDIIEQTVQAGFKSIREELTAQLAQLETRIARTQAENFKWMLGAVIGGIAISTSIFTVLLNSSPQKAPTPIVIYAQPNVK